MRARFSLRFLDVLVATLFALVVSLHASRAFAQPPRTAGTGGAPSPAPSASSPSAPHRPVIALTTASGDRGPVVLSWQGGALVGTMNVANDGGEPLNVSRVSIRGDDDDVRAPSRVSAHFTDGAPSTATIPPGTSKAVTVTWFPAHDSRLRQAFAHVIVTSNDETAGEVAMGVRGQVPWVLPFVLDHALTLVIFVPGLGALLLIVLFALGRGDGAVARSVALACTGTSLAIAVCMFWLFRGDVTRVDGNDGLQFVEHLVWVRALDVEYFVGVDGLAMPMVLVTSVLAFLGCVASEGIVHRERGYYALYLLLVTGAMGVFVAQDLFLFFVFWAAMLAPLYGLVALWGGKARERAASKLFVYSVLGSMALFLALLALHAESDRTFLVDGTPCLRSWSIPELTRVSFAAKHLPIFGVPFVKVVWVLLFVGFAVRTPIFPLHTWLPEALAEAPTPVALLLAGTVVESGAYGLVRVGFAVLPEGARWASATVVALGAVGVIYGALCAMAQDDLKRFLAYVTLGHMGFCLVGLGALTPQGVGACLVEMVSHGLVIGLLLLLVGALEDRVGTRRLRALGGLAADMPLFALASGVGLMASLGAPGLSGFWGETLALLGAFASYRALASIAAIGVVLFAAAHVRALDRVLLGPVPPAWRTSGLLERFGGRFPDLTAREIASVAPIAFIAVLLGVWPAPLFALISGGVRDATSIVNPPGPDQIAALLRDAVLAYLP